MSPLERKSRKRLLDDRFLRSLKPDPDERQEYSDTKCVGLRFRLSPAGRATWVFEKRIKGGPKRKFTLGTWPKPLSLAQARAMGFELLAEAQKGVDRAEEARREIEKKKLADAKNISCQKVLDAYRELHLNSIATGDERYRQISAALADHLELPISTLKRADLQDAVDRKAGEGRRPYANRIRAALVAFANWAFTRGYIDEPIGAGIAKAAREQARERVPSLSEVREIWTATYEMGDLWGPFFRVLILTGQRRAEIANLRWSEVDLERRAIVKPGTRTKNRRAHTTHLSEPALAELSAMKKTKGQGEYVFSFDGKKPVSNPSHAKGRLDELLRDDFEPWRIHDLRSSLATCLAEAGQPENIVDRILNHAASGSAPSAVSRIYQQSDLLPQRAAALDRWADMVLGEESQLIILPGVSNV